MNVKDLKKEINVTNNKLTAFAKEMNDTVKSVLEKLPFKAICLDDDKCVPVSAYYFDGDGNVIEHQVKGLVLTNGIVYAYEDYKELKFRLEDILDEEKTIEDQWFDLTDAGVYMTIYTLVDLMDALPDYLDNKANYSDK